MQILTDIFQKITDMTQHIEHVTIPGAVAPFTGWINIALGLLLCFFGARMFSLSIICFSGLLAGLGSYIWLAARIEQLPALVIAVIAGVLCAVAIRSLLKVGFFMLGVVLGGSIAGIFLGDSIWVVAVMLACGVVSMLAYRIFLAVLCALCGSLLLANELLPFIGPVPPSNPYLFPGLIALLFMLGLLFQAGILKKRKSRED